MSNNIDYTKKLGKYSGALHFFQFDFLSLSPPPGIIEVLSMGGYDPKNDNSQDDDDAETNESIDRYPVEGAYHCVLGNELAHSLHVNKSKCYYNRYIHFINIHIYLITSIVNLVPIEQAYKAIATNISIPLIDGSTKTYRVKIYDIGHSKSVFPNQLKGSNNPCLEDLRRCVVFEGKETDCDVSMVIGHFQSCQESCLLNLRFHEKVPNAEQFGKHFFNYAK